MEIRQLHLHGPLAGSELLAALGDIRPHLLLVFAGVDVMAAPGFADALAQACPGALRVGCSTAGEITAHGVFDDSTILTALHFEHSAVREASTVLTDMADSHAAGTRLAEQLQGPDLAGVLLLGQGVAINGSALVAGMAAVLGPGVPISGGLAGDGADFQKTWTLSSQGVSATTLVAVGFYGAGIHLGHGSFGGWEPFGPARRVTRCDGNVLYELDGEPALDIYKRYLGEYARELPASGLLFPFSMLGRDHAAVGLIRTILGVDEATGSLVLAGEIDPDGYLKLMHATPDALVDGAQRAAEFSCAGGGELGTGAGNRLAILVSCVGRKLVLGGRVDEEVEGVAEVLGRGVAVTGFYSYGEISPVAGSGECKLHNQTMTVTVISEN
ncbi:MAG TPA: FIST N-terminal domain-containing protein [Azospira sp.]|nr:FIST N-terminal domain-containing protein [Azospira sp.]